MNIDPQLLFQRLITVGERCIDLQDLMRYELCGYPAALFESKDVQKVADKSSLADAIWAILPSDPPDPPGDVQYVLDGGALLHRIIWPRGETYENICALYAEYVHNKYGQPTIVFDCIRRTKYQR